MTCFVRNCDEEAITILMGSPPHFICVEHFILMSKKFPPRMWRPLLGEQQPLPLEAAS